MKKSILLLFAALLPLVASAYDFTVGGIYYNITSKTERKVEVTYKDNQYNSYSGSITIPATVTRTGVKYSVTSIGGNAFSNCSSLTAINIPTGVTSIGGSTFYNCSSLKSITIPTGVTSIGDNAFQGCSSLTAINIPEGVTSIAFSVFFGCSGLTAIAIPEGVTSIGNYAFCNCSKLTAIAIPKGVTSIGDYTFRNCSSLTDIVVAEGNQTYDSRGGCNAIIKTASNTLISGCSTTIIPESVTSIGVYAFSGRSSLTAITIPKGVTSIGEGAFSGCIKLTAIAIPEGVAVFYASSVEGNRLMMTQVTGVLPANTGVIVRAEAGTYTFEESKDMPANVEGNLLSGTATDTYITAESGYKYYVLAQKDGLVAMYRPKLTDGRFLNNANKAYIALNMNRLGIFDDEVNTDEEGVQLSNSLRFDFGGTAGIEQTTVNSQQTTVIYDLQGRKVTDTEGLKGIYIVNGRKVVIK